jgi:hypothetical protein
MKLPTHLPLSAGVKDEWTCTSGHKYTHMAARACGCICDLLYNQPLSPRSLSTGTINQAHDVIKFCTYESDVARIIVYSAFFSLSWAQPPSQYVPADVGFPCDKAAVLGETIIEWPCSRQQFILSSGLKQFSLVGGMSRRMCAFHVIKLPCSEER